MPVGTTERTIPGFWVSRCSVGVQMFSVFRRFEGTRVLILHATSAPMTNPAAILRIHR